MKAAVLLVVEPASPAPLSSGLQSVTTLPTPHPKKTKTKTARVARLRNGSSKITETDGEHGGTGHASGGHGGVLEAPGG